MFKAAYCSTPKVERGLSKAWIAKSVRPDPASPKATLGVEAWIQEQAGIPFDAKAAPGALRVMAG